MANQDWLIMSGGKTFMAYMIKSCPDIPYIEDLVGEGNSGGNTESGPIKMGTKNVVYLSEEKDMLKIYVKMLDRDHHSLTLLLRDRDWSSHPINDRNHWRSEKKMLKYYHTIYFFNLNYNQNTYFVKKSDLRDTCSWAGANNIGDRKRNYKRHIIASMPSETWEIIDDSINNFGKKSQLCTVKGNPLVYDLRI